MSKAIYAPVGGFFEKQKKAYAAADGVLRKLKKSYAVVDGMHKLVFSADPNAIYTGTHTISQIDIDGVPYNLLTMTGSGVLTIEGEGVQVWCCGGGAAGGDGTKTSSRERFGPGGGGGYVAYASITEGKYAVTIGAGGIGADGGVTSIEDIVTANGGATPVDSSKLGGTGGSSGGNGFEYGAGTYYYDGTAAKGGGVTTYPFGIESLKAHSAGGGSAAGRLRHGNKGGTNGGDGGAGSITALTGAKGGSGGEYGGGKGADYSIGLSGDAGSFYGAGGGGSCSSSSTSKRTAGGAGYQGVGYVLWPVS